MSSRAAVAAPAVKPRRIGHGPPPLSVPRGPRRVSGPARREIPDRRVRRRGDGGIVLGLIGVLGSLAEHRLLDRLLRGRTWIALVAFALIGIVTMQLGLLKLNGGIGRALEREAVLQRENAALSIENSELAAGDRVQSLATRLGMEFVPAGALRFLTANPRIDLARGVAALSAHVPSGSSEESGAASTTAAPSQGSGAEAPAPRSGASSGSSESPSGAPEESKAAPAQSAPAAPESGSASAESTSGSARSASGESTSASAGTAPGGERSPSTAPSGSSSAEAAPGGGTQAGPQG